MTGQLPGTALHPGRRLLTGLSPAVPRRRRPRGRGSFGKAKDCVPGVGRRQRVASWALPSGGARATFAAPGPPPAPPLLLLQDGGEGLSSHWAWPQRQHQSLPATREEGSGPEPSVQAGRPPRGDGYGFPQNRFPFEARSR